MKPLLVSSGEPAGIGPDLCLALAGSHFPIVVIGDKKVLANRAKQLGLNVILDDYQKDGTIVKSPNHLSVLSLPSAVDVTAGKLNPANSSYVLTLLTEAISRCVQGYFSALITAPVNKAVINDAGITFTGHTEFFADYCKVKTVVMMLACPLMKVALVTTHLPLREVADRLSETLLIDVITQLNLALRQDFGINEPRITVAGLNPHAGEAGYLGREEIDIITPALTALKKKGLNLTGPLPADTMFTPKYINSCDAFVAMYHDQGLPVLKYAGFGDAVNVTLGLPIIRTSVDHGTALELAGTGGADTGSLLAAVAMAASMVEKREKTHGHH